MIDAAKIRRLMNLAADQIMSIYADEFQVEQKSDGSPLTEADKRSNEILCKGLEQLKIGPVVSEEADYSVQDRDYWLIDPLDGTKDFVNRTDQFAINVAFISSGKPIWGAILSPLDRGFTFCKKGHGVFYNENRLPDRVPRTILRAAESIHHGHPEALAFYSENAIDQISAIGASLKYVAFARNEIDIYLRINPTSEWDTAAGQLFVEEVGGRLVQWPSLEELKYNRVNPLNPSFIVGICGQKLQYNGKILQL